MRIIGIEQEVRKMADDNLVLLSKWGDEPFAEAARKEPLPKRADPAE